MAVSNTAVLAPRASIATVLFNPFYYLAGGAALALGIGVIVLTGVIGSFGNAHVDGVLDFHVGRPAAFWVYVAEGLVSWLVLALPLYFLGRYLSRSQSVRAVDVFGTLALARVPYLVAALVSLLPPVQANIAELSAAVRTGTAFQLTDLFDRGEMAVYVAMAAFSTLMLAWMVALMYRAYAYSCNLKGTRAVVGFVIVIIVAEIASKVLIGLMIGRVI